MPTITLHDFPQGSPEWHAGREGKYTGSNAYKLLGSFGATEYARAVQTSFKGNFYTKRGHILEDEAIELYEAIKGVSVVRTGWVTNSDYPDCIYSPDGLPPIPLLEVKAFTFDEHMKLMKGDIDWKILAQIHYGLLITGRPYAELLPYNPDIDDPDMAFGIIRIARNHKIINNFRRILLPGKVAHA